MPKKHTTCPIALMIDLLNGEQLLACCLKSLLKLVNSTACINEFLLAGKEGMTLGANFNSHFTALGGLGYNGLTASALDRHFFVIRMDSGLHFIYTSFHTNIQNAMYYITNFLKMQGFFEKIF